MNIAVGSFQINNCTHDLGQYSPGTDRLSSVNKMITNYGANKNNLIRLMSLVLTDILLATRDEHNLLLPRFARRLYFFFSPDFLAR